MKKLINLLLISLCFSGVSYASEGPSRPSYLAYLRDRDAYMQRLRMAHVVSPMPKSTSNRAALIMGGFFGTATLAIQLGMLYNSTRMTNTSIESKEMTSKQYERSNAYTEKSLDLQQSGNDMQRIAVNAQVGGGLGSALGPIGTSVGTALGASKAYDEIKARNHPKPETSTKEALVIMGTGYGAGAAIGFACGGPVGAAIGVIGVGVFGVFANITS